MWTIFLGQSAKKYKEKVKDNNDVKPFINKNRVN